MIYLYAFSANYKTQTNTIIHKVMVILKTHAWGMPSKYINPVNNYGEFNLTPLNFSWI